MSKPLSKIVYDFDNKSAVLEFNKDVVVDYTAKIYTWIMETEERVLIETLVLHGGKGALLRLRGVIDKALEREGVDK